MRSPSHDSEDDAHHAHPAVVDLELDLEHKVPYKFDSDENEANVNSQYYTNSPPQHDHENANDYLEPFVQSGSPQSVLSSTNETSTRSEKCMRKILQLTFLICIILFISPLIFFIAGASQIIGQYATIAPAVRQPGDTDDSEVKKFGHFPSVHSICTQGDAKFYCLRYIFFLIYLIIFIIMYMCCVSLFITRKDKHPLKSRSCVFISIFGVALPAYMIWACVGLMYTPSWLGCMPTHFFVNLLYPCLMLPYFFRACRIKRIYDEATTHSAYAKDMNIFRSARTGSVLSTNMNYVEETKSNSHLSHQNGAVHSLSNANNTANKPRSNSVLSQAADSAFNFDDALTYSKTLDKKLICWFCVALIPFIVISFTNLVTTRNHLLPTFIKSCDEYNASSAIFIWVVFHAVEIFALILLVYWIRLVWRAFSVKQELMIVAVIDMVYCACMIGFSSGDSSIDDSVLRLYLVLMRGTGFFMITLLLPLYKTYFLVTYLPEIPTQDVITSLQAILDDMDACVHFRQFMTQQDCQYLLDFWMEVDLFKDACYNHEIEDIYLAASKIFKKYFDLNNHSRAASMIRSVLNAKEKLKNNGTGSKKKTFCKAINKIFDEKNRRKVEIHPNIFDYPHHVIFEHMESTQYRLFLRSKTCKQLLASVAGQEEIFRKLINQEML